MFNPDTAPISAHLPSFETAARALNVMPIIAPVHSDLDIDTAIIALGREPGGGLVVMPDVFTYNHRAPIILAAARNNVPAVYPFSFMVREGGLISYGVETTDGSRSAATYVDRILRGAKPSDLPVQRATKIEFATDDCFDGICQLIWSPCSRWAATVSSTAASSVEALSAPALSSSILAHVE
jgi:putative ABC transport system substrate-binding protein